MSNIVSFKELIVWQKSHQFVLSIYSVSADFPKEETYALTSQLRRAVVSVPANIAEGFKKKTLPNKLNFISHSEGSLEEVRYYLILARDLGYIDHDKFENLEVCCDEISKLIYGYIRTIRNYYNTKQLKN